MHATQSKLSIVSLLGRMSLAGCVVFLAMAWFSGTASAINGFDLNDALIPENEIMHGGPPRDGIPSIDNPKFLSASKASFLKPADRVLGVFHNGIAKAYPILILNYHEIVNDRFGEDSVVVSFCPLCGTGMVFKSTLKGADREFGVSGLLYNSDMLLYDRESLSLWSQIMMQSVSGPLKGTMLEPLLVSNTSWSDWKSKHPETKVLSRETGHSRDYSRSPYPGYTESSMIMFPVSKISALYHPKEMVIGLQIDDFYKAYPFSELSKIDKGRVQDIVGGKKVSIAFDLKHRTGTVFSENNKAIPTVIGYWFAWVAFHPTTDVFTAEK